MSAHVRQAAVRGPDRQLGWSVFLILLGVYTATFCGLPDNPDAEVEFQTTSALARRGSLALGGTPEAQAIIERGYHVRRVGEGEDTRAYSWHGVGQAAAAVPLYGLGRLYAWVARTTEERHSASTHMGVHPSEYYPHLLAGWRNPLLGALTGLLIALTARRLGVGRRPAWIAAMAYGLTTFAWPQARSSLSDVQAAFFLFLAFHVAVMAREEMERRRPPRLLLWAGFGCALGAALLTRLAVAPAVAVVFACGLLALVRGWRDARAFLARTSPVRRTLLPRAILAATLPLLLSAGAILWLDWVRFGDALETGYGEPLGSGTFFAGSLTEGLAGLLLSPGRGLLWMAPLVVLAPWGLWRVRRGGENLWLLALAGVGLAVLLPAAKLSGWHGGHTFGPRYILPLLPFLWMGVALALDQLHARGPQRLAIGALLLLGLLVQLPASLVDHTTHQDLALQAARIEWPDGEGGEGADPATEEEARFHRIQWDWRFAAPWAHWRILRHRLAHGGEEREVFDSGRIFFLRGHRDLVPAHEREKGYRHLAWVDLAERLGGPGWLGWLTSLLMVVVGVFQAAQGLRRDAA